MRENAAIAQKREVEALTISKSGNAAAACEITDPTARPFVASGGPAVVENQAFDGERAMYGARRLRVENCRFDGPADGESALKEVSDVEVEDTFFNLRYPLWHASRVRLRRCRMTDLARAALWYCDHAVIEDCSLHGIKALRECRDVRLSGCNVRSAEFGWSVDQLEVADCSVEGEYPFMRAENLRFRDVSLKGKYSFQYIRNAEFDDCSFDTKDAFWHARNVTVRNSVVRGEYLGWYSDHLTFENCRIVGTQPLCYCTNLKLVDCEMIDCDLAFEKSDVEARILTPIDSVKNPYRGFIEAPSAEVVLDDPRAEGLCDLRVGAF